MCGICGYINLYPSPVDESILARMNEALIHRGPDDYGYHCDGHVGLAMRRLAIIDVAGGHQPISNEDGTITIILNGEIYNSPDLRAGLAARGHQFCSRSDTETIVHAYEERGKDCLSDLSGMFALAIYDRRRQRLMLARDRIGIKPLYYYSDDRILVFSSELTSLLQHPSVPRSIDTEALHYYLSFGTVFSPFTLFQRVRQLLPGDG